MYSILSAFIFLSAFRKASKIKIMYLFYKTMRTKEKFYKFGIMLEKLEKDRNAMKT